MEYPVKTKTQLKALLRQERDVYVPATSYKKHWFRRSKAYSIYCALRAFRLYEFYSQNSTPGNCFSRIIHTLKTLWLDRRRNLLGEAVGVELTPGMVGPGVHICHSNVVVFGHVGEGGTFHGNNVVGNKRSGAIDEVPILGKHVDVGFGACIIGKVTIADNCVIGAGAVVTKSFTTPGTIIAGVPAKEIGRRDSV